MPWMSSRVAWFAALISLFALLRALRRLVEDDDPSVALVVAVVVVAAAALPPSTLDRVTPEQAGWRKSLQFFGAGAATALAVFLGVDVVLTGVVGLAAAAVAPVAWPAPAKLT